MCLVYAIIIVDRLDSATNDRDMEKKYNKQVEKSHAAVSPLQGLVNEDST